MAILSATRTRRARDDPIANNRQEPAFCPLPFQSAAFSRHISSCAIHPRSCLTPSGPSSNFIPTSPSASSLQLLRNAHEHGHLCPR